MADLTARPVASLAWMAADRHREWLALTTEEAVEPGLVICDPHLHLWRDRFGPYLVEQLRLDTGSGHRVLNTIYVEASVEYREDGPDELRPVGETEFAVAQARESIALGGPMIAGIVSFADLTLGAAVEPVLIAHERGGAGLFRGIRYCAAWDPSPEIGNALNASPGLLRRADFRSGLSTLGRMGYVFDAWV
jgi:L-fuconolactonase